MLSRRFLRIKVLKTLFSYVNSDNHSLQNAEKELHISIQKTYDLYYQLLAIMPALADYAQERIDIGLQKFHPTDEESHPNTKFVDNQIIAIIRTNKGLLKEAEKSYPIWKEHIPFIKKLYQSICSSNYYKAYMEAPERSFQEDLQLVKNIYTNEFEQSQELESLLEEQSVYWIDDTGYVLGVILRTLDKLQEGQSIEEPSFHQIKNAEDEKFANTLLLQTMVHYEEYRDIIFGMLKNWEANRVAAMDCALIALGISEAKEFSNIPVKVSINEYVEIAKYYSTNNSHIFVNGLLDRILQAMVNDGTIEKKGRGLVESSSRAK